MFLFFWSVVAGGAKMGGRVATTAAVLGMVVFLVTYHCEREYWSWIVKI